MTTKSFIKTIGSKGLLSDYNTEGKKVQTELTAGENVTIANNVISSNQVFVATYGTTTYQEIKDAYDAGKICISVYDNQILYLTEIISNYALFNVLNSISSQSPAYICYSSDSRWSKKYTQFQKRLTFDTTPTAGSNNPVTSDGIKTSLEAKQDTLTAGDNVTIDGSTISSNQVFVATYGTTTYQEIKDAYDAGKICTVFRNGRYYFMTWINKDYILFTASDEKNTLYHVSVTSSDRWSTYTGQLQSKLTFDTTPTAGSTNPVTSDGIKTALDSRIPAPTSTTGTQVLKCIDGVVQWVADNAGSFATKEYVDSMLGNVESQLAAL